jgi:hypothetical protein
MDGDDPRGATNFKLTPPFVALKLQCGVTESLAQRPLATFLPIEIGEHGLGLVTF